MRFLSLSRATIARLNFCYQILNSNTQNTNIVKRQCQKFLCRCLSDSTKQEDLGKLRNIGIIAHVDAGKTTTTERMLYYSGFSRHLGDVDDGDTVMDYMEQERERGITITAAAITFHWNKYKVNLIDTPGHIDFTVEVERALRVLDGSVTVLDASAGVEAQTTTVWRQADKYHIPSLIYLNKMDKPAASVDDCLSSIKEKLNVQSALINFPVTCDRNTMETVDIIGLQKLTWDFLKYPDGSQYEREALKQEVDKELWDMAIHWRTTLIGQLADHDETIANYVLSDVAMEDVPVVDIRRVLRRCTLNRTLVPVLCGSSLRNMGLQPLLDAVCLYLPSPRERQYDFVQYYTDNLCALAFKTVHHKQRGVLTFLRIYSGSIKTGSDIYNVNRHYAEKVNRLLQVYADDFKDIHHAGPGNIVCISGLRQTVTGDTLTTNQKTANMARKAMLQQTMQHHKSKKRSSGATEVVEGDQDEEGAIEDPVLAGMDVPPPVFFCSIEPPSVSAQKQMEFALECLQREDPSFRVEYNADTGQTILQGMGELHLEIIKRRILDEYKVDAYLGPLQVDEKDFVEKVCFFRQVAYRETLDDGTSASAEESLERTLGGRRHQVSLEMILEQNAEARDFKKVEVVSSRENEVDIKWQQLKAIGNGVRNALTVGPILSYPVINVDVLLTKFSCKYGTSPAIISACASQCVHKALRNASTDLLEPMMKLQHEKSQKDKFVSSVTLPASYQHTLMFKDRVNSLLIPTSHMHCTRRYAHSRQKVSDKLSLEGLPSPLCCPKAEPLPDADYTLVYFDLETTDLSLSADIIEIAAVCENDSFRRYVLPNQPINPDASKVTGLHTVDGALYRHSEQVETVSIATALHDFNEWLQKYKSPVLIAHNCKNFDSLRLAHCTCLNPEVGVPLNQYVAGFVDTLPVFREVLPKRKSYAQGSLAKHAQIEVENAHCALDDARVLQQLVSHHNVTSSKLQKHSFSMKYSLDLYNYRVHTNIKSYDVLINLNVIGYSVASRLCKAGVGLSHLQKIYEKYGQKGFQSACKELFPLMYNVVLDKASIISLETYFNRQNRKKS